MAIENRKLLNVRIKNKYDSYENWASSGLVLEAGEIAIAYTTVDVKIDNGTAKHPALLMKVGDGTNLFKDLPWLSAKAADVLSVCKNENDLKTFVNNVIADAGIATDDALTALAKRVTTAESAITTLNDLVGTTSVQTQISSAIAALNLANTYAAKVHTHTKADITDFAHTHEMSEVNGLTDALAGKETAGEGARVEGLLTTYKESNDTRVKAVEDDLSGYKTTNNAAVKANADAIDAIKDHETVDSFADVMTEMAKYQLSGDYATKAEAKGYADSKDEAIAAAKKAGDDAQDAVDALTAKVGTVADNTTVVAMIEAVDGKVEELEETHGTDKAALETAIALKADKTALDEVSGVANAAATKVALEAEVKRATDEEARIEGLVTAEATKAREEEGKLDARLVEVETFFKTTEGETLDTALDTLVEIQKYLDGEGEVADQMLLDIAANKGAIEKLNGAVTEEGSVAKSINDAIVGLDLANTYEPKGAEDRAKTYADGLDQAMDLRVDAVEAKLKDIEANADVNIIETVKVNGVALTPDASKAVDVTVPTGALATKDKVAKADLDEALTTELDAKATEANLTLAEGRITALEDANKEGGAVATAIKEAKEAANAAQADVNALEELVGNEKVADQIDAKIEALDLTNTYEAKGTAATEAGKVQTALDTYKTDNDKAVAAVKATADTAVQTVTAAADSGLKATRAEESNDVVIAIDETLTFVLDCGTSAE